eukprot:4826387-Pleurochrysis_carterae.AAC.4
MLSLASKQREALWRLPCPTRRGTCSAPRRRCCLSDSSGARVTRAERARQCPNFDYIEQKVWHPECPAPVAKRIWHRSLRPTRTA